MDHFNFGSTEMWKQRYTVNDAHYVPGGPIFLILGGEGPINLNFTTQTMFNTYAMQTNGAVIMLEHRFYGESYPTTDVSVQSLRLLNPEQALADAAYFKEVWGPVRFPVEGPWIACGGSYSGDLSGWLRIKYPQHFFGAVASSAPVTATIDFKQYLQVTQASLESAGSSQCMARVTEGLLNLQGLIQGNEALVKERFNLCSSPNQLGTQLDAYSFMSDVIGVFQGAVQYNSQKLPLNITAVCDVMTDMATFPDAVDALANLTLRGNTLSPSGCLDASWESFIASINTTDIASQTGARSWTWQTCTAFAFWQTTDQPDGAWGNYLPVSFYEAMCRYAFEGTYTADQGVNWINTVYGSTDPFDVGRIIYPNGSLDPWHALSILSSPAPNEPALFINGTSHCQDWHPAGPNDPPGLKVAQQTISQIIIGWVQAWPAKA